jgi:hypothetical protein
MFHVVEAGCAVSLLRLSGSPDLPPVGSCVMSHDPRFSIRTCFVILLSRVFHVFSLSRVKFR